MRDEFSPSVKQTVANRVNLMCSNPDCRAGTGGPQLDPSKALNLGVAAHISAASPQGPRFDESMSNEDRKHADNAIWLCQNCAKLVDSDVARFPIRLLRKWKEAAEFAALSTLGKAASFVDSSFGNLSPEEIDILCAAATKGEIHVIEVDELSPWVMVNGERFADESDPACAAGYLEALESLQNRGIVRYEGGILYVLKGSGFKVARALAQARLSASENEAGLEVNETVKIPPNEHVAFSFEFDEQTGIRYKVDSNERIDVYLLGAKDYKKWRNRGEIESYYKTHESKHLVDSDFWPGETGEYLLIISNEGAEKTKAAVEITRFHAAD